MQKRSNRLIRLFVLILALWQVPAQAGLLSSLWNGIANFWNKDKVVALAVTGAVAGAGYLAWNYFKGSTKSNLKEPKIQASANQHVNIPEFQALVNKSKKFAAQVTFPTINNRISNIAGSNKQIQEYIVAHARNTYPILHTKVKSLIDGFLAYKQTNGTHVEKTLYANMSKDMFIDRLITQRPLMFMTGVDSYILRDGKTKGSGGFELIGTNNEKAPLLLKDYLSYDEMQIAALLGVSVPTYFINNGIRDNSGLKGDSGTFQEHGIYVGLVGARFEKKDLMEWQHMIITPTQNTMQNGYGKNNTKNQKLAVWSKFYGLSFPTFDEAKNDKSGRYISFENGSMYFDSAVYKERLKLVIEPFLLDAHQRGMQNNKKVYVHAVGIGLGVWQVLPIQAQLMLEVYADIIKKNNLSQIADIDFSWFANVDNCGGVKDGGTFKAANNQIKIHFSKRNPADILQGSDVNKLLVACYAWDGNSYPGNEYWGGYLTASGDPAAACCATIAELQNPQINERVAAKYTHYYGIQ